MRKRAVSALHRVDHALARVLGHRRILIELRTPMHQAILAPVYGELQRLRVVQLLFTSERPEQIDGLIPREQLLTHTEAKWRRFDLYLNADPWGAARLRRCARRVNFFHGVAGKYDLDRPASLPIGLEGYDRVAFINRNRMDAYLEAGLVTADQGRLVGYPKLDRLVSGRIDGAAVRGALGLGPRPTVLYAPTFSTASSLHLAGEDIVTTLARAGYNVLIKLHDRSLDVDARYTGGIDWRARMRGLERGNQIRYVEGPDASPYLAAADALITDHSSVGFEFLVLDRPLVVFDAPGLAEAARINPEKIALLRSAASVVRHPAELVAACEAELRSPERLSPVRRRVAAQMFHGPGGATQRAVSLVCELLHLDGSGEPASSDEEAIRSRTSPDVAAAAWADPSAPLL